MYDELTLQQGMTDSQRLMFQSEMGKVRKNRTTILLLTLFLGGVGAHHFYMGKIGLGVLYLLFFWTYVPAIVALVELFFVMKRADNYNLEQAQIVAAKIRNMAS